jgi:hypothetical protein
MNEPPNRVAQRWTPAMDSRMCRMRLDGLSWAAIAGALHLSRDAVTARGRRLGLQRPLAPAPAAAPEMDLSREPLPAGHPIAWDLLVEGTCLAGTPYPYPPLNDAGR